MYKILMDLISNCLTCIRNASLNKNANLSLPFSAKTEQFVKILKEEGFIHSYHAIQKTHLLIELKYKGKKKTPILTNLQKISKPGRRIYMNSKEVPTIFGGLGILVLSTSKGLITNKQASTLRIGGEVICCIW